MFERLAIKRGTLTPEDAEIVRTRSPHASSQYTRMQMMTDDFEESIKLRSRVSTCGATEIPETDRDDRLRDRSV